MQITRKSQFSGKVRTIEIAITIEQLQKWQNGAHLQNVAPHLSADEREFLITGITGDEWKELFGPDEEEEEIGTEPDEETQEILDKHIHDVTQAQIDLERLQAIGCESTSMSTLEMREVDYFNNLDEFFQEDINKDRQIEDAQDWTPY